MAIEIDRAELTDGELTELVELLRGLIRIKSVNPPGDEILMARHIVKLFAEEGVPSTVVEPFPGRGSIIAKLRGDGTGGDALLLLSHLDVVPAEPAGWSHDHRHFSGSFWNCYVSFFLFARRGWLGNRFCSSCRRVKIDLEFHGRG